MALKATVDMSKTPYEIIVESDRRGGKTLATGTVTAGEPAETAAWAAVTPIGPAPVVKDSAGRVIPSTVKSDTGLVAVLVPAQ